MWENIYNENRKLDMIFMSKYKNENKMYEKNCIEFMNEISEFANETKCFKYWSIKKMDKEKALEEYADVITMSLSFFTILDIELEIVPHTDTDDLLYLLNILYSNISRLYEEKNAVLVKKIFSDVLYLGDLFKFSDNEKYEACYKKMKIIEDRLNSDY
ncbi:MAG: dUTP diphosphatase [Bacilli bacterium]|nr:dUTP diphosphatase [Bacilli bacterium]